MLELVDFDSVQTPSSASFIVYGGNAGAKEAVIYNDGVWMIKHPKTTRDLLNPQISYTTSPLSEFLGSKIYESLGIPVHETALGIRKNKIVVACKDFTFGTSQLVTDMSVPILRLVPFHDLKNSFMSNDVDEYSGTGSETLLDEVLATINNQENLKSIPGVLERFWDMFVIDAFIGNNDRNNGNWGILVNMWPDIFQHVLSAPQLAPVYDNGNAFFNKRSVMQMQKRLEDDEYVQNDAYNIECAYKYTGLDNEGHKINPFEFIESGSHQGCTDAGCRFMNSVDMAKIEAIINDIPEHVGTLAVMPRIQKEFYTKLLKARFVLIKNALNKIFST
ncbi:MAG: CtkA family protein [Defluviitaleaceae bacterium]|nr:CtkA family protein [Defluviitaleaceae bacterium]